MCLLGDVALLDRNIFHIYNRSKPSSILQLYASWTDCSGSALSCFAVYHKIRVFQRSTLCVLRTAHEPSYPVVKVVQSASMFARNHRQSWTSNKNILTLKKPLPLTHVHPSVNLVMCLDNAKLPLVWDKCPCRPILRWEGYHIVNCWFEPLELANECITTSPVVVKCGKWSCVEPYFDIPLWIQPNLNGRGVSLQAFVSTGSGFTQNSNTSAMLRTYLSCCFNLAISIHNEKVGYVAPYYHRQNTFPRATESRVWMDETRKKRWAQTGMASNLRSWCFLSNDIDAIIAKGLKETRQSLPPVTPSLCDIWH